MRKIGIVNRTNLKNYGSVLQVFALYHIIKTFGYDSEVVWQSGNMSKNWDIRPNKVLKICCTLLSHPDLILSTLKTVKEVKDKIIDINKVRLFDEFVSKHFEQSFYAVNEIEKIAASDKYFKFVCGSDQVWVTTTLYPDPMMYLQFAPRHKRVAYAPSLGRDYIPRYNKKTLNRYISEIDYISVREDTGKDLIKELIGRDVPVVADPTLLISSNDWNTIKIDIELTEHYILCYFLDEPSDLVKKAICKYAKENKKKIVVLGQLSDIDLSDNDIIRPAAGPGEFLSIVCDADMVITDSYHGMLFAINYHKLFWSVRRNYSQFDQSSRQLTVLRRLDLESRYLTNEFIFTDELIDYDRVQSRLSDFVEFSIDYLKTSLNN